MNTLAFILLGLLFAGILWSLNMIRILRKSQFYLSLFTGTKLDDFPIDELRAFREKYPFYNYIPWQVSQFNNILKKALE